MCVLVDEFVDMHESSTYSYEDVVTFFDFDENTFLTELIDSFWFS